MKKENRDWFVAIVGSIIGGFILLIIIYVFNAITKHYRGVNMFTVFLNTFKDYRVWEAVVVVQLIVFITIMLYFRIMSKEPDESDPITEALAEWPEDGPWAPAEPGEADRLVNEAVEEAYDPRKPEDEK